MIAERRQFKSGSRGMGMADSKGRNYSFEVVRSMCGKPSSNSRMPTKWFNHKNGGTILLSTEERRKKEPL